MIKTFSMPVKDITIPESAIAIRCGFKNERRVTEEFKPLLERALLAMNAATIPLAIYDTYPCKWDNDLLRIGDQEIRGYMVNRHLRGCEALTLMLATLGSGTDETIAKEHEKGDDLSSFFFDALASELAEFFARRVDLSIREESPDFELTARVSPGYGDLPMSLNKWVVDTLQGGDHGITCNPESFILLPRKTISAFIGWRRHI